MFPRQDVLSVSPLFIYAFIRDLALAPWAHLNHRDDRQQVIVPQQAPLPTTTTNRKREATQLQRWAYEVSNDNLTVAERLEKSRWEASLLESLCENKKRKR